MTDATEPTLQERLDQIREVLDKWFDRSMEGSTVIHDGGIMQAIVDDVDQALGDTPHGERL